MTTLRRGQVGVALWSRSDIPDNLSSVWFAEPEAGEEFHDLVDFWGEDLVVAVQRKEWNQSSTDDTPLRDEGVSYIPKTVAAKPNSRLVLPARHIGLENRDETSSRQIIHDFVSTQRLTRRRFLSDDLICRHFDYLGFTGFRIQLDTDESPSSSADGPAVLNDHAGHCMAAKAECHPLADTD